MSVWKLLTGRWGSSAGETDEVRIDASTNSLQIIDYAHHEVHSGSHYYIQGFTTLGNDPGVDDILRVMLVTPSGTKWTHLLFDIKSIKEMTTTFDEGATGGMTGGLRVTIHANNRNTGCHVGIHTGGDGESTVMTDSTAAYTIDALIGSTIYNSTDGSSAIITDNDATTITVDALLGGTDNDWDTDDQYEVNDSKIILTSGVAANHIQITLGGTNDAIVSVDAGTTDGIYVPAGSIITLDNVTIGASVAIQAKNATGGSNYASMTITIW